MTYGRRIQRYPRDLLFAWSRRDLPPADRQISWTSRLEGTVALGSLDGGLITVYRQRKA